MAAPKSVKLIVDRLPAGAKFGFAKIKPEFDDTFELVRLRAGKVRAGQVFSWHLDEKLNPQAKTPPRWASPTCKDGAKLYTDAAKHRRKRVDVEIERAKAALARLQAEASEADREAGKPDAPPPPARQDKTVPGAGPTRPPDAPGMEGAVAPPPFHSDQVIPQP